MSSSPDMLFIDDPAHHTWEGEGGPEASERLRRIQAPADIATVLESSPVYDIQAEIARADGEGGFDRRELHQ